MKLQVSFIALFLSFVFVGCKDNSSNVQQDTILTGTASILVDENLIGLIAEQKEIFELDYKAEILLEPLAEAELINKLIQDSSRIAILTRELKDSEAVLFKKRNIIPKVTIFGYDAVVLIGSKKSRDSIVAYTDIDKLMHNQNSSIKGLIFDNPNSSIVRFMSDKFGTSIENNQYIFSMKSEKEVFEYITSNPDYIGCVSLYTYSKMITDGDPILQNIRNLNVKIYNKAFQKEVVVNVHKSFLASNLYPFRRPLYVLNYQGRDGLGIGFASFVAGNVGQLITEKAGLLPVRISPREVNIRKEVIK